MNVLAGGKGPTVVDLFCGCGGFSLGATLAGFRSLVSVDIDPTLQSAYRKNFPSTRAIQANIKSLDASSWNHILGRVKPDAVIGGPPCQGFSWIGRRNARDPRNDLIFQFFRQLRILRPKFFIMENVPGLLDEANSELLAAAIDEAPSRYRILKPLIVNAADYGAATTRRRVALVGYDPEHVDAFSVDWLQRRKMNSPVTVRDAIVDLPRPISAGTDVSDFGWARYPKRATEASAYADRLRAPAPKGLGWKDALHYHEAGFVSGLAKTVHSAKVAKRYNDTPHGSSDPTTKSYRLAWDGQCPTLRAGTGSDKGAFQAVRPLHPSVGRVITVREAARMQGFPDWFVFHQAKWHSFRMLGNSVSPAVSKGLMAKMKKKMHLSLAP